MPPPVWAAAERPDARLSIAELRARLGLLGVSIQGLSERSELESAHRQAMWPSPELSSPEPDVQALCELHRQLLRLALYLTPDVDERAARAKKNWSGSWALASTRMMRSVSPRC